MIEKLKRMWKGGARPEPTLAERARLMAHHHKEFMEHDKHIEAGIAHKRADIDAGVARISALQPPKVKA